MSAAAHSTYLVQQLDVVVVLTRLEQLYQPAHAFNRTNPDVICRGAVREGTTASTCERGLTNGAKAGGAAHRAQRPAVRAAAWQRTKVARAAAGSSLADRLSHSVHSRVAVLAQSACGCGE